MKVPCCDQHFGRGAQEIRIYRGPTYNKPGAGFFGDAFRKLIPLLTKTVFPFLGKKLFETGGEVMRDIESGTSIGTALKSGAKRTFQQGKESVLKRLTGSGLKRKRQKRVRRSRRKVYKGTRKSKRCQKRSVRRRGLTF